MSDAPPAKATSLHPITQVLHDYYRDVFNQFGAVPRGVDYTKSEEEVALRYRNMLAVAPPEELAGSAPPTFLDVGCGYGGLLDYAQSAGLALAYTGIDVVEEMIASASGRHPGTTFLCSDLFAMPAEGRFDYVVCNTAVTERRTASIRDMDAYVREFVSKMFALARKGIAINFMTTKVNFMAEHLYYINPVEMFAFCLTHLTTKLRIDHAYPLYEYTVYLYRTGALE